LETKLFLGMVGITKSFKRWLDRVVKKIECWVIKRIAFTSIEVLSSVSSRI